MNKIWCLFSVDNEYNQPPNNLVAWWPTKPNFEGLLKAMGGTLMCDKAIIATANVMQGQETRYQEADWRLTLTKEGIVK